MPTKFEGGGAKSLDQQIKDSVAEVVKSKKLPVLLERAIDFYEGMGEYFSKTFKQGHPLQQVFEDAHKLDHEELKGWIRKEFEDRLTLNTVRGLVVMDMLGNLINEALSEIDALPETDAKRHELWTLITSLYEAALAMVKPNIITDKSIREEAEVWLDVTKEKLREKIQGPDKKTIH